MEERRTCSKVKPWIYFLMELVIYFSIATIIIFYFGRDMGIPLSLFFVGGIIYYTKSFQRLERILKRTDDVRQVKVKERYEDELNN